VLESGGGAGGKIGEQALIKLIRGFVLREEEAFIDGLKKMNVAETLYLETKKRLDGEERRKKINEIATIISCPNCGYRLILDQFIEVAFNVFTGDYRCPNCGAVIKYNFVEGNTEGFIVERAKDSFLGVNVDELRRSIEKELSSVYGARVLGETNFMVAAKVEAGKLKLLVREVALKASSESWSSDWSWRVEVAIDENWHGEVIGVLNFSCKWMGAPSQIEILSPLRLEKRLTFNEELAREISKQCTELENEAYERISSVLEEAKLAVAWVYPAKAVMLPAISTEEDFVSELKKKIKEKEEKKEERI